MANVLDKNNGPTITIELCRGVAMGGRGGGLNLADQLTFFKPGWGQIMPTPPDQKAIYTSASSWKICVNYKNYPALCLFWKDSDAQSLREKLYKTCV